MHNDANKQTVPKVAALLDRLDDLGASGTQVTVNEVQERLGRDAFGPSLLALGLLALSPIGDIPGLPTILSVIIVVVAVQMAVGRDALWIPDILAKRNLKGSHLRSVVKVFRPSLRFLGYIIWPRLSFLTDGPFARAIAVICAIVALTLPPLEFVPFGATIPSSLITGFSIAIVARDGLLALVFFGLLVGAVYFAFTQFA